MDDLKVVNFLKKLIRTPSISGEEQEIAEIIAKQLEIAGLSVDIIGGNVVGRMFGSKREPTLILNGHMDTVPVGDREKWNVDPFGAEVRNGKIYGRGSSDMKGGLAAMVMALDVIKSMNIELYGNLVFTAVVSEELGTRKFNERIGIIELIDKGVIKGNAAIVGEPTSLEISIGHRHPLYIEIVTRGKSAHASMPEKGVNAIEKMAKMILALNRLEIGYHEILGRGTLSIGLIKGGTRPNMVPEYCKIVIDRRLTMGETPEKVRSDIEKITKTLMETDKDLEVEVRTLHGWYPTLISSDEPIIGTLSEAVELAIKHKPRIRSPLQYSDRETRSLHIQRMNTLKLVRLSTLQRSMRWQ
jgi:succinyl-diaminopimelate desuccinylase